MNRVKGKENFDWGSLCKCFKERGRQSTLFTVTAPTSLSPQLHMNLII